MVHGTRPSQLRTDISKATAVTWLGRAGPGSLCLARRWGTESAVSCVQAPGLMTKSDELGQTHELCGLEGVEPAGLCEGAVWASPSECWMAFLTVSALPVPSVCGGCPEWLSTRLREGRMRDSAQQKPRVLWGATLQRLLWAFVRAWHALCSICLCCDLRARC